MISVRLANSSRLAIVACLAFLSGTSVASAGLMLEVVDSTTGTVYATASGTPTGANGSTVSINAFFTADNHTNYSVQISGTSVSPGTKNSFGRPASIFARLNLSSVTVDTDGPGSIAIEIVDSNYAYPTPGPGNYLKSFITTGASQNPANNVTFSTQSFADAGNDNSFLTPSASGMLTNNTTGGPYTTTGVQGPFTGAVASNTATKGFSNTGPFSLLNIVNLSFGTGGGSITSLSTEADVLAPEPATLAMAISGLPVALILIRRRPRAARKA